MFIDNPAVKHTRICDRADNRGHYRQTLVVETDLAEPLHYAGAADNVAGLMRDLRQLQDLASGGFAGFENIEISGLSWKTIFAGETTQH